MNTSEIVTALSFWRRLEGLTLSLLEAADNDNNWVTVANVTGRGHLISCGMVSVDPMGASTYIRITVDGGTAETLTLGDTNGALAISIPMEIGFDTSLLVEMAIAAVGVAQYQAVVRTE